MHPAGTQKTVGTHELSLRVVGTADAVVGEQRPRLLLAGLAKARLAGGDFMSRFVLSRHGGMTTHPAAIKG